MSKLKIAVIGCGSIANNAHIPAYIANEECEIIYFCDIIPERAEKAVKEYGCGKAVKDYKDILSDKDLDAISVCTPNDVHSIISIDFLRAGKHVLCEKPPARIYSEALEMQKACNESGKILNIGVCNRYRDGVNIVKKLIDAGELGEIYQVCVSFRAHRSIPGIGGAFTTKAISGGGVMIDWGVHYLDLVMYCTSDPAPKSVTGQIHCKLGKDIKDYVYEDMWAGPPINDGIYDVDDFVTAIVKTDGPAFTLNGAWAQNIAKDETYIDFLGTKAGVRMYYFGTVTMFSAENGVLTEKELKDADTAESDFFQNEIDAFIRSIQTGKKEPNHIDTVIITAKIMQAIYDSSDTGREIVF